MAGEEDTELRDLVAQTLEAKGVLGKIRAQLRAHVFLALEEQEAEKSRPSPVNEELVSFSNTHEGRLVLGLVREFLEFYELSATLAVFEPEADVADKYSGRTGLARDLNIVDDDEPARPLLDDVLRRLTKPGLSKVGSGPSISNDLRSHHIVEVKEKFVSYDKDHSGQIGKEATLQLFMDLLPHFSANMLECFVNDEFPEADRDPNDTIDIEQFLAMYKKLFSLCRSVVSNDISGLATRMATGIGAEALRADSGKLSNTTELMNRIGDGQSYASTSTVKPSTTAVGLGSLTDVQSNVADFTTASRLLRDLPAGEQGEQNVNSVGSTQTMYSRSSQRSDPRGSGVGKEDGREDLMTVARRLGVPDDYLGNEDDEEHGMGDGGNEDDLLDKLSSKTNSGMKRMSGSSGSSQSKTHTLADDGTKELSRERDILARASDRLGAVREPLSRSALPPLSGTGSHMSTLSGAPALGRSTGSSPRSFGVLGAEIGQSAEDDVKKLADINSQLSKLGIGFSLENDLDLQDDGDVQNYDDDFNSLGSHHSAAISIPESLEEAGTDDSNLLDQKLDDLLTSDHTVSQGSFGDYDYMESVVSN